MITSNMMNAAAKSRIPLYAQYAAPNHNSACTGRSEFHQIGLPPVSRPVFLSPNAKITINPREMHAATQVNHLRNLAGKYNNANAIANLTGTHPSKKYACRFSICM